MQTSKAVTAKLHVVQIEDHEGSGRCGHCSRENLRWIAVLSDGSRVGTECAKRVLGIKISPAKYAWVQHYEPVATYDGESRFGVTWVLWQRKGGIGTRETRNGNLMSIGGCRADWVRRGWLPETTA